MDILATLWAPGVERLQSPALLAQRFLLQLLPHLGFRSSDCAELLAPLGLGMAFCLLISPIGETDAALVVLLCLIILYLIYNYIICVYIYIKYSSISTSVERMDPSATSICRRGTIVACTASQKARSSEGLKRC